MFSTPGTFTTMAGITVGSSYHRAGSLVSSHSGTNTLAGSAMTSTDNASAVSSTTRTTTRTKSLYVRNGRTYVSDPTFPNPLPVDLTELHRQNLRTMLLFQLFGGPVCSPRFATKAPKRVLEVGCGSGFWSMMCYRYYARQGRSDVSFTGIDMSPIAPGSSPQRSGARGSTGTEDYDGKRASAAVPAPSPADLRPDPDMKWRFVQHDMRKIPWPFPSGEFDLIMAKDMSLSIPLSMQQAYMDEYLRVLSPGGTLEIWESDHTIRMLRPHVPETRRSRQSAGQGQGGLGATGSGRGSDSDSSESEVDEQEAAASLGAYVMTGNTPLSSPLNNFLVEYNGWISRALESRGISAVPCTLIGPMILQEAETLTATGSRRLAVPLSEVRWEREGVGGVVTKDGKSYIETRGKGRGTAGGEERGETGRALTTVQAAVRKTAMTTVVQKIQSLESVLREVSGKSQDEWDLWMGKMMSDLIKESGASWGESLEVGAWWARKKS